MPVHWRGRAATPSVSTSSITAWRGNGLSCSRRSRPRSRTRGGPAGNGPGRGRTMGRHLSLGGFLGRRVEPDRCATRRRRDRTRGRGARTRAERRTDRRSERASLTYRDLIVTLAARHQLPVVYYNRFFVTDGSLISYGANVIDQYRRAAGYVDRSQRPSFVLAQNGACDWCDGGVSLAGLISRGWGTGSLRLGRTSSLRGATVPGRS